MALPPPKLPAAVRTVLKNMPLPLNTLYLVVYNPEGVILHFQGPENLPSNSPFWGPALVGRNIRDIFEPPIGVAAGEAFHQAFFRDTHFNLRIRPLPSVNVDVKSGFYIYNTGIPARIAVRAVEETYLAALHPQDYYMERAKGRLTQDMMALLNPDNEIVMFCNAFLTNLMPKPENGRPRMETLTDAREWQKLIERDKIVMDYYRGLLAAPGAHAWAEKPSFIPLAASEWVEDPGSDWRMTPDALESARVMGNSIITCLRTVEQTLEDVLFTCGIRCDLFFSVGVNFHVDIYRSSTETSTPDHDGYHFCLRRSVETGGRLQVLLRRKTVPCAAEFIPETLWTAAAGENTETIIGFEKTAGAFTLYINKEKAAVLYDTAPLTSPYHNFIGFAASHGTRLTALRLYSRRSLFDRKKIPSDLVDLQFYKYPGHVFETRLGLMPSSSSPDRLRYAYMKDVTYSRGILEKLNRHMADIDYELETAKKIQAVLANIPLPHDPRIAFAYCYRPSHQVGGDLFDIKKLGDDKYALLIYDVSGHGIGASLISSMAKMSFDNAFKQTHSPSAILELVNNDLCTVTEANMFLTAFLAVIDVEAGHLVYARAGHCLPAIFSKTRPLMPVLLHEGGPVLGSSPAFEYAQHRFAVQAGDRILIYTDGIIEIRNPRDEFFDKKQLYARIKETMELPLEKAKQHILDEAERFMEDGHYEDDITFILTDITRLGAL